MESTQCYTEPEITIDEKIRPMWPSKLTVHLVTSSITAVEVITLALCEALTTNIKQKISLISQKDSVILSNYIPTS